jgi:hypothetical protein
LFRRQFHWARFAVRPGISSRETDSAFLWPQITRFHDHTGVYYKFSLLHSPEFLPECHVQSTCSVRMFIVLSKAAHLGVLYAQSNAEYEVWLWSSRNIFIASLIPVYLKLTERGHLHSTLHEQLCT